MNLKKKNYNKASLLIIVGVVLTIIIGIVISSNLALNGNAFFTDVGSSNKIDIKYNYNLFDASLYNNSAITGYNKTLQILWFGGGLEDNNIPIGNISNVKLEKGEKYKLTLIYVNGSYEVVSGSEPEFVFELQKNGESYSNRENNKHYVSVAFPNNSNKKIEKTITITDDNKDATNFYYWVYQKENSKTTFNKYRMQIFITKEESKTVSKNGKYGTMPTPVKEGYEFLGWYDSLSGFNKKTSTSKIFKKYTHTLYAHWDKKEADVVVACSGEYENGDGLAKLNVSIAKGSIKNYKFLLDGKEVQNGSSSTYTADSIYTLLIKPQVTVTTTNGAQKTINCEVKHIDYASYQKKGYTFGIKDKNSANPYKSNELKYFLYIPESAANTQKSMPLVIGFHGGTSSGTSSYRLAQDGVEKPEAIVIAPGNTKDSSNWNTGMYQARDIIYSIVKQYNIDFDHIVVNGGSQGGYATLLFGFLEEQVIYYAEEEISLEEVAKKYGTTADEVKQYNMKLNNSSRVVTSDIYGLRFKDGSSQKILKKGSRSIIRPKNDNEQRSMASMLIPNSPARSATRCAFTPEIVKYNNNSANNDVNKCADDPAYMIKTPIWIISSDQSTNEYDLICIFSKTLTDYYENHGKDINSEEV